MDLPNPEIEHLSPALLEDSPALQADSLPSDPITPWQIEEEKLEPVTDVIFLGSKITEMVTAAMKLKDFCSLEGKL